ncbi:MAG: hypothetical protein WD397_07420 [Wenzhouxiangellaceae bacterium]
MNRVNKLILGVASLATLVTFLSQCPSRAERVFCARLGLLSEPLAASVLILPITVLAACCFTAMLLSTALHHRARGHNPAGRARSLAMELVWVAIPILIIVAAAIPASGLLAL